MAWWNWLGNILHSSKEVVEVFTENKEKKGQRTHAEYLANFDIDKAVLKQFSTEFNHRTNRTWWDSFVDGLNRLPRPLLTIITLGFFVLAPLDPVRFLEIAKAYELMPPGYWALISVIISFYFGGRMQIKSQDMAVKREAILAAKEMIETRQKIDNLEHVYEPVEVKIYNDAIRSGYIVNDNKVVTNWRETALSE